MTDTAIMTEGLTGVAAIGGVLVLVLADGLKDRRRTAHERARRGPAGRRHRSASAFELENLLALHDGLGWYR